MWSARRLGHEHRQEAALEGLELLGAPLERADLADVSGDRVFVHALERIVEAGLARRAGEIALIDLDRHVHHHLVQQLGLDHPALEGVVLGEEVDDLAGALGREDDAGVAARCDDVRHVFAQHETFAAGVAPGGRGGKRQADAERRSARKNHDLPHQFSPLGWYAARYATKTICG